MSEDTRSPEQIVADLVEKSPICMVTTTAADGRLEARPMTRQDSAFDGRIRFLAPRDGDLVTEVRADSKVIVSVQSSDGFVSVSGRAEVDDSRETVDQNWNAATEAWFPDGPETAVGLVVHADSAEYWDSSGSTIAHVASFVRAAVSGDDHTPDMGTSGTVEL